MDQRLRPRDKKIFTGFTKAEVEKMEKLLNESADKGPNKELYRNLARRFCKSADRAGKPVVKWNEIESWFENRKEDLAKASENFPEPTGASPQVKELESPKTPKEEKVPELEFEARSSKDGAWYDVDMFIAHRFLSTGEPETRVRYVGFGAEEDEWVNLKRAVRERSIPLESTECHKVKLGDLVLCFQERKDGASYFDAHVLEIKRRMHDIRGCRCVFLIRYDHDDHEEKVLLKRLCRRPTD